jgi:hypothetical protein
MVDLVQPAVGGSSRGCGHDIWPVLAGQSRPRLLNDALLVGSRHVGVFSHDVLGQLHPSLIGAALRLTPNQRGKARFTVFAVSPDPPFHSTFLHAQLASFGAVPLP